MFRKMLLPHQGLFLQAPFIFSNRRFHLLVCGYGAGKTSSDAMAVEYLASMLQGRKDAEGHRPRILLGGVTLGHLEKTTLGYIIQDLETSKTKYKHDSKNNILRIGDVDVLITPLQNPNEIMGYDVWASVLDEVDDLGLSTAEDTTFEAVKAVNERTRQKIPGMRRAFVMMASTSQGQKGLYRLYTQFKKSNTGFTLIRGRTRDNKHLDVDYVNSMYDMYSERERLVFLEGHFLAISRGQVFGDFDWDRNYIDYDMDRGVSPGEVLFWGQDFNQGYHRGSVYTIRGNTIYCLKWYEFPDIRSAPMVIRHDFPRNKIYFIPDTTAKDEVTHFLKELRRHNIHLVMRTRNPIVEDSAFLVNKLLYTRRLIISKAAREVAEALSLAQRDKNGQIPKGVGPSSPIHTADGTRLVCFFIACNRKEFTDIRRVTMDRHLYLTDGEESGTRAMAGGYSSFSPDTF